MTNKRDSVVEDAVALETLSGKLRGTERGRNERRQVCFSDSTVRELADQTSKLQKCVTLQEKGRMNLSIEQ